MSSDPKSPPTGGNNDRSRTPSFDDRPNPNKNLLAVPSSDSRGGSLDQQAPSDVVTLVPDHPSDEDANPLRPDPNNPEAFHVEDNRFAFTPGMLGRLLNPKSLAVFRALGGMDGLEKGLRTDRTSGLNLDEVSLDGQVTFEQATGHPDPNASIDIPVEKKENGVHVPHIGDGKHESSAFQDRLRVFGDNRLPEKKSKSLFELMWIAFKDKVLILLSCAAVISLALGIYQTVGVKHKDNTPKVEWVEGVAIVVAIVIVVCVGAGNDYQKERQFVRLNRKKEDRMVKVIRSGKSMEISVHDLLVGDVVHMEPGDMLPADGIFISGHNVKCDESSATGESDQMKKVPASEVMAQLEANAPGSHKLDPFIISGGKVLEGVGTYMVTSVGVHSSYGKIMMAFREESSATPLQMKLNDLAEAIAKLGGGSAAILFLVLFIRFLVQLKGDDSPASDKAQKFMRILITAITVVVVAVPEGLPLAVTLALAFATTRMLKDNNLVRVLRSCETMGNATTICSDKTGTLTQNRMTVVAGTIGADLRFDEKDNADVERDIHAEHEKPRESAVAKVIEILSPEYQDLLKQSIVQNSTAFEGEAGGTDTFIGSKTETALLMFARNYLGMGPVTQERVDSNIVQLIPFDSARKCMGVVIRRNGSYRLFIKGASEIVLRACTQIVVPGKEGISTTPLSEKVVEGITETINGYASRSLRTIGLLYRDFDTWPPKGAKTLPEDPAQAEFEDIFEEMTWIGIVGIQDPLRDGVPQAVAECKKAGVFVRMVTGDNVNTAKAIAAECGIYTPENGGIVMEGPTFRNLSPEEMDQKIPRLQVLARSSPEDKRILVRRLKELGHTVAVTGDGTNDGPALKMADVGFAMGIAGTEVAKEASSIILMDDNFSSIVKALMWGRAVNDAVKKFLQFQLTVNITAVLLTFITAVSSDDETSVLSAVQLLWVNLIMDTFAALALATDPPAPSILNRKPDPKSAPLITVNMWKMIIGQSIYQLAVSLVLHFAGKNILGYDDSKDKKDELKALIFNAFVWMQIFNQYNNRRLDNKFNIFEGVTRNWFFIGINLVMIGGQVMIIFVGGAAFSVTKLDGVQWAISIIIGAISLPIAVIIRLIPDQIIAKIMPRAMTGRQKPTPIIIANDSRYEWSPEFYAIRDELRFLKMIRGGRINQLRFRGKAAIQKMWPSSSKNSDVEANNNNADSQGPRSRSGSMFALALVAPSSMAFGVGRSPIEKPQPGDPDAPPFAQDISRASSPRLDEPTTPRGDESRPPVAPGIPEISPSSQPNTASPSDHPEK
ncbi:putative calcium-transporting ATPase 2 [Ascodesmis nigricans]|uniref:Calcium-transporting ATPase n=1 Tax=Ascodesmis nigricans TaxID=341454 RepID=A0A4S2MJ57_9PEZI|nr:putative calcium-transporting ATPase 2 [Ascodesmis nigricans]